jgi:Family of unknown function (DUF5677)
VTDNQPLSEWIEFAETLGQLGYDIIGGKRITHTAKGFLEPKVLSITLLSRALSNFRGAIILLTNGLVVEARILVRSCYENLFWIGGLIAEGDKFAQKMLHADVKSKHARVEFIFEQGIKLSEKLEKKLRAQMRDMKKKSPKPQPLHPQDVALGGVLRDGYLIYSQLSADAAHPSLESLNRHIVRLPNNERIIDVVPASAMTQTDGTGQRSSLARMSSAGLVQTKGLRLALCSAR